MSVVYDTNTAAEEFKERCQTIKTMLSRPGAGDELVEKHRAQINSCLSSAPESRFVFVIYKSSRELLRAATGDDKAEILKIVSTTLEMGQRYMPGCSVLRDNEEAIDYCVLITRAGPTMPDEPAMGDKMVTHFLTCRCVTKQPTPPKKK